MELRHLRYFVAVAEALNFRKASERLHVTQPTLSNQIKDLENEIGVQLLDRNTRGVQLTEAGVVFLREARLILKQISAAVAGAREKIAGRRRHLAVGYFDMLLARFMPAALKEFHHQHPEVEVVLVEMLLGKQAAAVKSGAVQIGFLFKSRAEPPCRLPHLEIVNSPIRAVLSRDHPLAKRERLALADLAKERLVCLAAERGSPREHLEFMRRVFADRGLKTGPIGQIEGPEAFRVTLESGLGISLVMGIGSLSQSRKVVLKPLTDTGDDLLVELFGFWSECGDSELIREFLGCLRAATLREMERGESEPPMGLPERLAGRSAKVQVPASAAVPNS